MTSEQQAFRRARSDHRDADDREHEADAQHEQAGEVGAHHSTGVGAALASGSTTTAVP